MHVVIPPQMLVIIIYDFIFLSLALTFGFLSTAHSRPFGNDLPLLQPWGQVPSPVDDLWMGEWVMEWSHLFSDTPNTHPPPHFWTWFSIWNRRWFLTFSPAAWHFPTPEFRPKCLVVRPRVPASVFSSCPSHTMALVLIYMLVASMILSNLLTLSVPQFLQL